LIGLKYSGNDRDVRISERFSKFVLKNISSAGPGSGLKYSPDATFGKCKSNPLQRSADCGRMMCKIIIHGNSVHLSAKFHPSLHSFKRCKCVPDLFSAETELFTQDNDAGSVRNIMLSECFSMVTFTIAVEARLAGMPLKLRNFVIAFRMISK